jgi:hypothetical protein
VCPVLSLLTIFPNSVVDRRRLQDFPCSLMSLSTSPFHDSFRTVAWCNVVDNPASLHTASARMCFRKLGRCRSTIQNYKHDSTRRPTFLHHAATAKLPSSPTSIRHPWPDRTFTTIWLRPLSIFVIAAPPTSHLNPLTVSTANCSLDVQPKRHAPPDAPIFTARTRNRGGKPKATCTTPGEHY